MIETGFSSPIWDLNDLIKLAKKNNKKLIIKEVNGGVNAKRTKSITQ